jgi:hypothetical protein
VRAALRDPASSVVQVVAPVDVWWEEPRVHVAGNLLRRPVMVRARARPTAIARTVSISAGRSDADEECEGDWRAEHDVL